jgi:hypothetical protein
MGAKIKKIIKTYVRTHIRIHSCACKNQYMHKYKHVWIPAGLIGMIELLFIHEHDTQVHDTYTHIHTYTYIHTAFDQIDRDGSNSVDRKEMAAGLFQVSSEFQVFYMQMHVYMSSQVSV